MASSLILEFTDDNFDTEVIAASLPTLVEFWAVWSAPSRAIAPTIEKLATTYAGKLRVGRLDIDSNQLTPQRYGIRSIPTLLLFKQGNIVNTLVGAMAPSVIANGVVPYL